MLGNNSSMTLKQVGYLRYTVYQKIARERETSTRPMDRVNKFQ
jgi:hypothetical protein